MRIFWTLLFSSGLKILLEKKVEDLKHNIKIYIYRFFAILILIVVFLCSGIIFGLLTLAFYLNSLLSSNCLGFAIVSIGCFIIFCGGIYMVLKK